MINTIKVVIVALMAIAIAFSSLAPVFGETLDKKSEREAVLERVREVVSVVVPQKLQTEKEDVQEKEEKTETRETAKKEVIEEVVVAMKILQEISTDILAGSGEVTKTIYTKGIPEGFSFGYELREMATGEAVRYLQRALNTDPETRVAVSGGGSLGNETTYFGPNTKQALIRFQRKHGLSVTGVLDSQTRSKINEVLQRGVTIRETAKRDMSEIRERVNGIAQIVEQLKERISQLGVEK